MDKTPKILIVADEPSMMVDMFLELEGRGFAVEPVRPGDCADRGVHHAIDAAIFDLHAPNQAALAIVSGLQAADIPVITLGNGPPLAVDHGRSRASSLPKPVNYERLADLLFDLTKRPRGVPIRPTPAALGLDRHDHESSAG